MSENNNEDYKMNYVYIVFIGKQVFQDNCERLYDQEILKVFFVKRKQMFTQRMSFKKN